MGRTGSPQLQVLATQRPGIAQQREDRGQGLSRTRTKTSSPLSLSVTPELHGTSVTSLAGAPGSDTLNAQGHGTTRHYPQPTLAEPPSGSHAAPDPRAPIIPSFHQDDNSLQLSSKGPLRPQQVPAQPRGPCEEPGLGSGEMGHAQLGAAYLPSVCRLSVQPAAGLLWRGHSHN